MKGLPKRFQYFFIFITALALLAMGYTLNTIEWTTVIIINLFIFGALAVASESLPVALPRGGYVTVSYAIFFAGLILFPRAIALSIAASGGLFVFGKAASDQPLFKRVFNGSQYVLSLKAASIVIDISGILAFNYSWAALSVYFLAALTYVILNMTFVSLALGLIYGKSPGSIWISNIRWSIPNFLALAPLGLLMASVYNNYGAFGLLLFSIPLLLSRHSFQRYMDMRENYLNTIEALVQAIEAKDQYTRGHSDRVAQYAVAIAEELKLPEDRVDNVKYTAILHDVGKIGVSENILNKQEKLLEPEWNAIRNHPIIGQNIVVKRKNGLKE